MVRSYGYGYGYVITRRDVEGEFGPIEWIEGLWALGLGFGLWLWLRILYMLEKTRYKVHS